MNDTPMVAAPYRRPLVLGAALIVAALVLGLLLAWASRGEFTGKYAVPSAGSEPVVAPPTPSAAPAMLPPAIPLPRRAPPPVVAPAPPPPAPVAQNDDERRIAGALERTTLKALRRGEPVKWHKAGQSGYVTVSDLATYPDRVCRNVSATITTDQGETRSSSHLWCASPDSDDWAPA